MRGENAAAMSKAARRGRSCIFGGGGGGLGLGMGAYIEVCRIYLSCFGI